MAQEMREEVARNNLVCFADNSRDIFGFGVVLGPGLPMKSRLLFYRMHNDSQKQNLILLGEDNPLVVIWRIDLENFRKHLTRIFSLACTGEPSRNIPLSLYNELLLNAAC